MSFLKGVSKYKNTIGAVQKKDLWYPDLKPNTSTGDFNGIAASSNWIAYQSTTNGTVALIPLTEVGKRKTIEIPTIHAHSSAITDITFDPFDDNTLATSSEDCTIKIWNIKGDANGIDSSSISAPLITLSGHKKRVDCIQFHPNAKNIIASGSSDKTLKIWDLETGKEVLSIDGKHDDIINCISWNWNGDLLATVSKDRKIRIFNARSKELLQCGEAHQGVKPNRILWLGESNRLFTTGFSKTRERQFGIWDGNDLSKPLVMSNLDNSTGVLDIYYDPDTSFLVLAGKGDGSIKVFEIEDKAPFYRDLITVQSDVAQKSSAVLPKRSLDLMNTEIIRVLKLGNNAIVPVSFSVPRKSKTDFQEDLYPPTRSTQYSLTSRQFLDGETKGPNFIQLKAENKEKFWFEAKSDTVNSTVSLSSNSKNNNPSPTIPTTPNKSSSTISSSTDSTVISNPSNQRSGSQFESPKSSPGGRRPTIDKDVPKFEAKEVQVVRSSKYRHIIGKGVKQDLCYNNVKAYPGINNRGNPTFFAVPLLGAGGRVGIFNLKKTGKQPDTLNAVECGSDCLDFDFSPFHDDFFATVTESAHIQTWKIPSGGLTSTIRTPVQTLKGHTRRVTSVDFHPIADNVVVTSAGDYTIRLWDLVKSDEVIKLEGHTDSILSISWNWNGSLFASSSKDKELRIFDPRTNKTVDKTEAHDGVKGFKTSWVGNREAVLTVGFSKGSQRQVALWDLKNLSKPLAKKEIDNGAGIMTPFYDHDTGVLYLSGKGDGNIKMFEIENDDIHHLTDYTSSVPTFGLTMLPKWSNNIKEVEIGNFLKLCGDYVEPLHFTVPRTRTEFFQDDIITPTRRTNKAALNSADWFDGQTKELEIMSLKPEGMQTLSENPVEKKEKKYDFNAERDRDENQFTKEKFLDGYYKQMGTQRESDDKVLKQDLMDGVADDEWND